MPKFLSAPDLDNASTYGEIGVPESVYTSKVNFKSKLVQEPPCESLALKELLDKDKMIKTFNTTLVRPFFTNYVMLISSTTDPEIPRYAALQIVRSAARNPGSVFLPYWANLIGGYHDKFLHDEKNQRKVSMLIVDSLGQNATPMKIEKAYDLLRWHQNVPRIVIVNGKTPVDWMIENLYLKPTRVLHFNPIAAKTTEY